MMLHLIDLHKRVLQMASMRADGSAVLREARLPATEQALGSYLNNWPRFRHRLVCETTGAGTGWPTTSEAAARPS